MKKYCRPTMVMEAFTPDEAVAACNKLPDKKVYREVTVDCLAQSQDKIFTGASLMENSTACAHVVDPNGSTSSYFFFDYDDSDNSPGDGLYFAWLGNGGGQATAALREVMKANGITNLSPGNGVVWHCGPVEGEFMKQLYSHS